MRPPTWSEAELAPATVEPSGCQGLVHCQTMAHASETNCGWQESSSVANIHEVTPSVGLSGIEAIQPPESRSLCNTGQGTLYADIRHDQGVVANRNVTSKRLV